MVCPLKDQELMQEETRTGQESALTAAAAPRGATPNSKPSPSAARSKASAVEESSGESGSMFCSGSKSTRNSSKRPGGSTKTGTSAGAPSAGKEIAARSDAQSANATQRIPIAERSMRDAEEKRARMEELEREKDRRRRENDEMGSDDERELNRPRFKAKPMPVFYSDRKKKFSSDSYTRHEALRWG